MNQNPLTWSCPIPKDQYPHILLAHGGGGKLMHQLIQKLFVTAFRNPDLELQHDGALLDLPANRIAFTTDSYVVRPLFFPGGNIGHLAVHGTVNDLAMCGARPLFLSAGFILEEGLSVDTLWDVVTTMQHSAQESGVRIVTGDTKVVEKGKGDGLYINTAGVGVIPEGVSISPKNIRPGDVIILNGDIARHGLAILSVRESLAFESEILSDTAPLSGLVQALLDNHIPVHCLRDATRGGVGSVLIELAESSGFQISVDEPSVPVREDVRGVCEILGFDPMFIANEGRMVAFVPSSHAEQALEQMRRHPLGKDACIIGRVNDQKHPIVTIKNFIGSQRVLDLPSGEQLPRIC